MKEKGGAEASDPFFGVPFMRHAKISTEIETSTLGNASHPHCSPLPRLAVFRLRIAIANF